MVLAQRGRTWLLQFGIAFGLWTLLAFVYAFQRIQVALLMEDRHIGLWEALWPPFMTYWICAALTPPVLAFARRVTFERARWPRFVTMQAAGLITFVVLHAGLRVLIFTVRNPRTGEPLPRSAQLIYRMALLYFNDDIFVYFPIVGAAMAYTVYVRNRDREMAESKLQAQLAGAELQILKMQLQPHFLFNTLQAISTLVGKDPSAAKRMIWLLGDLLRAAIDRTGEQEVPLREELDLLDRYVQIELVRFGERLEVEFDVDAAALDCIAPALILQPLVENAIRHGARGVSGRGEVRVRGIVRGDDLSITIEDNGPGFPADGAGQHPGVGLTNTRARLTHLYGTRQRLELENREGGGARVRLTIPVKSAGHSRGATL